MSKSSDIESLPPKKRFLLKYNDNKKRKREQNTELNKKSAKVKTISIKELDLLFKNKKESKIVKLNNSIKNCNIKLKKLYRLKKTTKLLKNKSNLIKIIYDIKFFQNRRKSAKRDLNFITTNYTWTCKCKCLSKLQHRAKYAKWNH
jgi:hypothetical protein